MSEGTKESSLSEESVAFLEEVKKGKPRRFAMICKGSSVVSLIVFKKGSLEKYKKEAKESGKGQFYYGVIDGRGQDITFKLSREDGFDSPPVKNAIVKQFLGDAGLKFKPIFEIVAAHTPLLDDSHPLVARYLQLQPKILSVCDAHPERAGEIELLMKATTELLSGEDPGQAEANVQKLESLVATLLPVVPSSPPSSDQEELRNKLQMALSKIVGQLKEAIARFPEQKVKLLTPVAEIKNQLEQYQLAEARQGLLMVGQMIKDVMSQSVVTPSGSEGPPSEPIVPSGTVDFAKCRLAWDAARRKAQTELQRLEAAILQAFESSPAYNELSQKLRKIDKAMELFPEELTELLGQALEATDPELRAGYRGSAAKKAQSFLNIATTDPWIDQLQNNPFLPIDVKPVLTNTLNVLVKKLS